MTSRSPNHVAPRGAQGSLPPGRDRIGLLGGLFGNSRSSLRESRPRRSAAAAATRKLWTENAIWSRQHLVAALAGTPDERAAADRLRRSHDEIGASLAPYLGQGVADALTKLLHEQVALSAVVASAAKARDDLALARHDDRWAENTEAIAGLLASANERWPLPDVIDLLALQRALLRKGATARVAADWTADAVAFDELLVGASVIADLLTDGLVQAFPDRFTMG